MNALTKISTVPTMTSLELVKIINELREDGQAELRHTDFTAKVRKVLGEEGAKFSAPLKTPSGQTAQGYILPKREAHLMVMSESYKVQATVYDRMVELENNQQPTFQLPATLSEALLLAGQLAAEKEKLETQNAKSLAQVESQAQEIEILEPKAQALDRIATASQGSMCLTDAAKTLQQQPRKFTTLLSSYRWMYKRVGSSHWVAYQDKIQSGYLEHKEKAIKLADGSDKMTCQVLVTAKGLAKLSAMLSQGGAK